MTWADEPDHMAEMKAIDPRRRPRLSQRRAREIAAMLDMTVEEVLMAERQKLVNWESSGDPEGYWWDDEERQRVLEASPEYGRG